MQKYSAGETRNKFDSCATKLQKIICKTFYRKWNVT